MVLGFGGSLLLLGHYMGSFSRKQQQGLRAMEHAGIMVRRQGAAAVPEPGEGGPGHAPEQVQARLELHQPVP